MPSPFPGMDPFLEHADVFPGLHDRFVAYLSEAIQPQLPEPYYAEMGDRLWVETSERLVPHDEFREPFVQIFARSGEDRLVTVVEVLSLSNKTPGARGRELYRRKQAEVLAGEMHLVEIDLLRGGEHTTAVPLARASKITGPFDYHVCVHRFDNLEDFLVYPIQLEQRLPTIEIPLLPGDGAVPVDLQGVFDRCYDAGPYRRRIRYGENSLVPALTPQKLAWAKKLLENGESK